jgi:hypothetical protein
VSAWEAAATVEGLDLGGSQLSITGAVAAASQADTQEPPTPDDVNDSINDGTCPICYSGNCLPNTFPEKCKVEECGKMVLLGEGLTCPLYQDSGCHSTFCKTHPFSAEKAKDKRIAEMNKYVW